MNISSSQHALRFALLTSASPHTMEISFSHAFVIVSCSLKASSLTVTPAFCRQSVPPLPLLPLRLSSSSCSLPLPPLRLLPSLFSSSSSPSHTSFPSLPLILSSFTVLPPLSIVIIPSSVLFFSSCHRSLLESCLHPRTVFFLALNMTRHGV